MGNILKIIIIKLGKKWTKTDQKWAKSEAFKSFSNSDKLMQEKWS